MGALVRRLRSSPVLEGLVNKYKDSGLTVIAPTRFGYVDKKKAAGQPKLAYIEQIRDQYPWMKTISAPIGNGVPTNTASTTPTYVMIDRDGRYRRIFRTADGRGTRPLIQKITAVASTSGQKAIASSSRLRVSRISAWCH